MEVADLTVADIAFDGEKGARCESSTGDSCPQYPSLLPIVQRLRPKMLPRD